MIHATRFLGLLGLATLAMITILVPQGAGALAPPKGGVVEVTGFRRLGLDGSSGPVVVVVQGRKVAALRTALAGLPPKSSPSDCMETIVPFTVSFLPRRGARPTMVANAFNCDGFGVGVMVGHSIAVLQDDCGFQSLAISTLPRSRTRATSQVVSMACPGSGN